MNEFDIERYDKKQESHKSARELEIKTGKDGHPRKRSRINLVVGLLIGLLVVGFLIVFSVVDFARRPVLADTSVDFQYFEVEKGRSIRSVGADLGESGLIRSSFAFYWVAKLEGVSIQAGHYKLSPSMSTDEILQKMASGEIDAFRITIPEGYRALQIAKLLEEKGDINQLKFVDAASGTEGTLFPDTYVISTNTEVTKIVRQMKENFEKRTEKLRPSYEQLILASIIEREAKDDDERTKIAAVYKNRTDNNMLLQADPTVRYALDSQAYLKSHQLNFDFWQPITKPDYQNLSSSFNTYKQKGYPPAPICNPGLKSIEAAVNPAKDFGDYFYFFHDKDGTIRFSKTFSEHQEQIQKYGVSGQ